MMLGKKKTRPRPPRVFLLTLGPLELSQQQKNAGALYGTYEAFRYKVRN